MSQAFWWDRKRTSNQVPEVAFEWVRQFAGGPGGRPVRYKAPGAPLLPPLRLPARQDARERIVPLVAGVFVHRPISPTEDDPLAIWYLPRPAKSPYSRWRAARPGALTYGAHPWASSTESSAA